MTDCEKCGASLTGLHIVPYEDHPFEAGDAVPREGDEYYDVAIGYVICPGCERHISVTPKQYREGPPELL